MKICLVTAFPPSQKALNEYGYHLARELRQFPSLSLTILGDDVSPAEPELPGFEVIRCWSFNRSSNLWRLLQAIRQAKPDIVWLNLGFASFGDRPLPAFLGTLIPALARMGGYDTHITLHQLMETVDLKDAGVRSPLLYKLGGFLATHFLLSTNSVSVLLPAYRSILRDKYRRGAIYVRKHGTLWGRPEYPDFTKRGNPEYRVLAFGKWGTYKRLEPMIEAFEIVAQRFPDARLIVAGTDHPKTPGYLNSIEAKYGSHPKIDFIGYVPEKEIAELFQSTSIVAMPYTSSAGSSGIAHLACAYGVPIVASDIPDCRQLVEEENMAIDFCGCGNTEELAETLVALLENPERQVQMALQNFSAALQMSMPSIVRDYVRTFDLQRRLDGLRSISRVRRLPRWVPLRPWLARRATDRAFRESVLSVGTKAPQDPDLLRAEER